MYGPMALKVREKVSRETGIGIGPWMALPRSVPGHRDCKRSCMVDPLKKLRKFTGTT